MTVYVYLFYYETISKKGKVYPEFPTGNGKVDLMIRYAGEIYALELKSFTDEYDFKQSQKQAAQYAASFKLNQIFLIEFVEHIPDEYRLKI